ncbi:MAG: lipoyl(octanoyl) transferase LipB [Gemmatimonadetes bacterium]|nr:MAG: lipoyl(octanoyl) transferase LipB [Gemmatimonadota bacterium]
MNQPTVSYANVGVIPYKQAWDLQRQCHQKRCQKELEDVLILCQHPHVFTVGRVGTRENILIPPERLKQEQIQVFDIDRGGDITYHGPGQLVGYPILDLHNYYLDVHRYLRDLEEVIIRTLADYHISAGRSEGLTGVWLDDRKIAAMGIKVSKWVTMHGFSFNIQPDLGFFGKIVPCGITDKQVTSLAQELGREITIEEVLPHWLHHFAEVFQVRLNRMDAAAFYDYLRP